MVFKLLGMFVRLRVCTETLKVTNLSIGTFLASSLTSMVMSADHPSLTFSLSLIRSEPTYNQPVQQWSFVSDFAVKPQPLLFSLTSTCQDVGVNTLLSQCLSTKVRDYSGTYTVKLIACTTAAHQEYSLPVICNPREPITFDLDIRFQQVAPQ